MCKRQMREREEGAVGEEDGARGTRKRWETRALDILLLVHSYW